MDPRQRDGYLLCTYPFLLICPYGRSAFYLNRSEIPYRMTNYLVDQLNDIISLSESCSDERPLTFNASPQQNSTQAPQPHRQRPQRVQSPRMPVHYLCPCTTCWTLLSGRARAKKGLSFRWNFLAFAKPFFSECLRICLHEMYVQTTGACIVASITTFRRYIFPYHPKKLYCFFTTLSAACVVSQSQTPPSN